MCYWNDLYLSNDVQFIYSEFLDRIKYFMNECIPTKIVTMGPRDPKYITPVVKSLLKKRTKLRRKGRIDEANVLAQQINSMIVEIRKSNLKNLDNASVKELWSAVNSASKPGTNTVSSSLGSPDSVNLHFAQISYDAKINSIEHFKQIFVHPESE